MAEWVSKEDCREHMKEQEKRFEIIEEGLKDISKQLIKRNNIDAFNDGVKNGLQQALGKKELLQKKYIAITIGALAVLQGVVEIIKHLVSK